MESALLLDVVVGESAAVFELLAGEDQALLVWGNALLVLDLGLDVVDGVARLDLKGDGLAGEGLDEDLHTTTQAEDEVKGGLLLDVVIAQGAAILELLSGEDKALLVWGNALLVLDLALHIVDGVGRLDLKGDGLARQGLNEAVAIYALVAVPSFAHVYSCRGRSVRFPGAVFGSRFRGREYVHLHC